MAMPLSDEIRPLKRSEYGQLIALGAFENERVELLDGVLVEMTPNRPPHSSAVQKLGTLLIPALLGRATVRIQGPFAASETSEPEPDVAVVPLGDYDTEHPNQAYLVVEVAESSLKRDRGVKRQIYAKSRVPEYWIVSIRDRSVEVHREPGPNGYGKVERIAHDGSIRPLHFADLEVKVRDIVR